MCMHAALMVEWGRLGGWGLDREFHELLSCWSLCANRFTGLQGCESREIRILGHGFDQDETDEQR